MPVPYGLRGENDPKAAALALAALIAAGGGELDAETKQLYEEMKVDVPTLNETHTIMQQLLFTNTADVRFV